MSTAKKHKKGDRVITSVRTWEVGKTKDKGTPYVRVRLEGYISWLGWLTPGALEYTVKALETMGFTGSNIKHLASDNALNPDLELHAVIGEVQEYNGKTYYEADFINVPLETGFNKKAKKIIETDSDFNIDVSKYLDDSVISEPKQTQMNSSDMNNFTADDIPF